MKKMRGNIFSHGHARCEHIRICISTYDELPEITFHGADARSIAVIRCCAASRKPSRNTEACRCVARTIAVIRWCEASRKPSRNTFLCEARTAIHCDWLCNCRETTGPFCKA